MDNIRRAIATFSIVAILSSFVVSTAFAGTFTDVKEGTYYYDAVEALVEAGTIPGTVETYNPGGGLTRALAAKYVVEGAGWEVTTHDTATFKDVPKTHSEFDLIETAVDHEFMKGSGAKPGYFLPTDTVNRAEYAKMAVLAFELETYEPEAPTFTDVKPADWFYDYVETAAYYKVVKGKTLTTFAPSEAINRADGAVMTVRAVEAEAPAEGEGEGEGEGEEVTGGDLTVGLSDSTPAAITLPDGTAFNELTVLDFTAGDEDVEVDGITITRSGLMSDSYVKVSVWVGGARYGNVLSVSEGEAEVTMNDPIEIAAGETIQVSLAANIDAAAGSGTLALGVDSADDIDTAGEVTGDFPATGETFGVTDGSSSVAAAQFDVVSLATTTRNVDVGQKAYEITRFKISETSSKEALYLNSIVLFNNGNSSDNDLGNITVKDQNGEPLGIAEGSTDKVITVNFDEQYEIPKGTSRYLYVYVDVLSGSTRTAQFILQNDFDLTLEGKSTGASVLATVVTGGTDATFPIGDLATLAAGYNHITINEGSLSLTKDNSSPSGDVTLGSTDVVLGTFKVEAQGEDVELQQIAIDLSNGSDRTPATSNTTGYFDCVEVASATTCTAASTDLVGSIKVQTESGKTLYTVSAATLILWNTSPAYAALSAYHTVPAGTSETLKLVGSINSSSTYTGAGETLKVGINKIYYYKKNSLKYADTGSAAANTMSVTTSALSVSQDTSYGAQTVVAGTSAVKIGQFNVKASSAEGVNITSIGLSVNNQGNSATDVKNLKIYKGADNTATQLGSTQTSVGDTTAMTISVSGFSLAANAQQTLSVYADLSSEISNTETVIASIALDGISGTGQVSQSSATGPSAILALQTITVNTSGVLTVATADDNPASKILVAGTLYTASDADVAKFKLTASKAEDLYLKKLTVRVDTNGDDAAISGAVLYGSSSSASIGTIIGTAEGLQQDTTRPGYITWSWTDVARPMILSNSSYYVTVKANFVSSSQGTVATLTPKFSLVDADAEGSSQLVSHAASDTGLVSDTIAFGTMAADAAAIVLSSALTATATTMTVGTGAAAPANFTNYNAGTGYYCFISSVTDDANFQTGEEVVYVMGTGTAGVYEIERGVMGTTAVAGVAGDNVYCVAAKAGNAHTVQNTKATMAADTSGLDTSAKTSMKLAKFTVSAANNTADPVENKVTMQKVRVTVTATNADASVFYLYTDPEESTTYRLTGRYIADSVVEFLFADQDANGVADAVVTASVYDDIVEGGSRTYLIKANTVTGTNGSLDVKIAALGSGAITAANYGASADVLWNDETAASIAAPAAWVNQVGTDLNLRYISWSSATGTPDTTAPALSSVTVAGNADGNITAAETITITFSEAMAGATATFTGSLTDIKKATNVGTITADCTAQGVSDGILFTYGTVAGVAAFPFTPAWSSSTVLVLTAGVAVTAGTGPTGTVTPSSTLFMDIYGNAGVTGAPAQGGTAW